MIFGGLGQNVFNPALLGRAFLQAAFPVAITTWPHRGGLVLGTQRRPLRLPVYCARARRVTGATPLGLMKFEDKGTALCGPDDRHHRRLAGRDRRAGDPCVGVYLAVRNT